MFIYSCKAVVKIQQFWRNFIKIFSWEAKLDTVKVIGACARMQNASKMIRITTATASV
jgi:hypothetical protein